MAGVSTIFFLFTAPKLCLGHGLVGYIQRDGSAEICTLRSTMGNADGNYGPLTVSASTGDACGNPPGTPKRVLAYSGDGTELRETQAGSGPYWLNPEETDATCRFKPGDKINAFVYISGNHGGTATWEHRALSDGEGVISNADFEKIPNAVWDYSPSGPPETAKALGPHVETFIVPSNLQAGWQTLRWNWISPGPVQFVHCVDVQIDTAIENSTTTRAAATQQPTTTTSVVSGEFSAVDGGSDRACRGASSNDNAASHYTIIGGTSSLEACKGLCRSAAGCVGIEYNSGSSRCEIWTRSAGIGASVRVRGYQCLRYTAAASTTMTTSAVSGEFSEVDGGIDRACRGAGSNDNAASHYTIIGGTSSLEACKGLCRSAAGCVGIEYNSGSLRCEVWTRSAGIGASVRVRGYQCLRYTNTTGTTTAPAVDCAPIGDCSAAEPAWCMQSDYEAWCSAQGVAGSCPAPWCLTSTLSRLMAAKVSKHIFLGTALLQAGTDIIPAMRYEL